MKEFLLSLISPLKMKKYRFMSVFISMLIFVLSIYFISIPHQVRIKANKEEFLSSKEHVNAYLDLPDYILLGDEFKESGYKVDEEGKMTSTKSNDTYDVYSYNSIDIMKGDQPLTINIHLVFDLKDKVTNDLIAIQEKYVKVYPDDSDEVITYSSYLTYVDRFDAQTVNDDWYKGRFDYYHGLELSDLEKRMDALTNFDLFDININKSENNYMIMFFSDGIVSQIPYFNEETEEVENVALNAFYETNDLSFDFSTISNLNEFGNQFTSLMFGPLFETEQTQYLLQVLGYTLLFTAIYSLILCWTMRKRGVLKTYKEYYNIAAISSVAPLLITFVLSWFVSGAVVVYGALFCAFTLFTYIKINTTPELGD